MKLKINGFHTAVVSYADGIGDWLRDLSNAGFPVVAYCVDGTTGLMDLQPLLQAGGVGYCIYRKQRILSTDGIMDVPDYNKPPEEAAAEWWSYLVDEFPPELDKEIVWTETINEVDKNRADWVGWFCYYTGILALQNGWKWLGPSWSTGEPEKDAWQTPGFLAYLKLCGDNPERLGVSLHEYSLDLDDILAGNGYLVGRFRLLHEACDENGLPYPTIFMTEWGWTHVEVPPPDLAIAQIIEAGAVYAPYPNIKGVAIWALDEGWQNLHLLTHALMQPLKQAILDTEYPDPTPPPESFEDWLIATAEANRVIDYNAQAALQKAMVADGYMPYSGEVWETYANDGQQYAVQGSRIPDSEPPARRVYYAPVGQWDNVQFVQQSGGKPPNGGSFRFTNWPTNYDVVTQRWGNNPEYYGQFGLPGHEGVDIRATISSPVMAVAYGIVSDVRHEAQGHNYGRFVRIRHLDDYETTYAHLDSVRVTFGQIVHGGEVIGTADSTGNSTGSHLHLSLKKLGHVYSDRFGIWPHNLHDPTPFLEPLGGQWPPPIDNEIIDMLSFMMADSTAWRVVRHPDGSQEDFQDYSYGNGVWVMAKGSNGEWWRYDSQFIYLFEDTSPAPDSQGNERFYKVNPGIWCQRLQETGKTFNDGGHVVQFFSKSSCLPLDENSGAASNNTTILRIERNYTFNTYGQNLTLDEVIFVQGNTELQIFARHQGKSLGRVGWRSDWGESEIVELYFDRPPLAKPPRRYCT